jgi:hypothetical protein
MNGRLPFGNFILFLNGELFINFFRIPERPSQAIHEPPLQLSKILGAKSDKVHFKISEAK